MLLNSQRLFCSKKIVSNTSIKAFWYIKYSFVLGYKTKFEVSRQFKNGGEAKRYQGIHSFLAEFKTNPKYNCTIIFFIIY